MPEVELRQLAESLPEADVIVGGPTGQSIVPTQVGPVLLTSATNKGKFIARLEMTTSGGIGSWKGDIVELNDRFADDPRQTANIEEFRRQLAARDFASDQTSFIEALPAKLPRGYSVAGNKTCQPCHEDDCILWRKSKHSQAWNVLKEKGAQFDPECQRCHTTGYGLPGGFTSVQRGDNMLNVGCESCHGPSKAHVVNSDLLTAYAYQSKDRCKACHDRENSPKFNYDEYWGKIFHGDLIETWVTSDFGHE